MPTIDRHDLQSFFPKGIKDFIPEVNEVAHKRRDFDKPDYPYITFGFRYVGLAPWENFDTQEDRKTVSSDSDQYDYDVEVDKTKQHLLTISQDVLDETKGRASWIAQRLDLYWRHKFDQEAWDNGYDDIFFYQIDTVDVSFDVPGETRIRQKRQSVDAQIVTTLDFLQQIVTIEHVEVASDNEFFPGEKLP